MQRCEVRQLRQGGCNQWSTGPLCFYHQKLEDGYIHLDNRAAQSYAGSTRPDLAYPKRRAA